MNTDRLGRRLHAVYLRRTAITQRYGPGRLTSVGLEHRQDPRDYHWDGLARSGDPDAPFIIFQYTLKGFGVFERAGAARRVEPGQAFVAVVPSAHRYYLPADSPGWTFLWFLLPHAYVVQRLIARLTATDYLLRFDPQGPVMMAVARLFEGVCLQSFRDEFTWESAVFDVLFEFERSFADIRYERSARDRLLAQVADRVRRDFAAAVDVSHLAAEWGMSRSHFSHHFKSTTGLSPAQYVADLRLEQVVRLLTATDDKLERVARQTGFADATHLCRVFRRHLHVSPGEYRKQLRSSLA